MATSSVQSNPSSSGGWLDRLLAKLSCIWDVFQDVGRVLKYARLSLLVTLIAGLVLIFIDQGQDLLVIHAEEPWSVIVFYPVIVFWAVNAWYWARSTLAHGATVPWKETCANPYFGGRLKRVQWLVGNVPRLIGTGAFVMIAIAQLKAAFRNGLGPDERIWLLVFTGISLGLAIAFYVFTVLRRRMSRALAVRLAKGAKPASGSNLLMLASSPEYEEVKGLRELPASIKGSFIILSLILVALFILVLVAPAAFARLGPDVVFLVGASLWIAPGTWLLFVSKRGDFPVLTWLVLLALAFSCVNDNHALRRSAGDALSDPGERIGLEVALAGWAQSAPNRDGGRPTLVMVATAGGGSRAAYWTASVLGTIQDLHPDFDKQLFGISGVSGGSLGAIVYRGLLTALPGGEAACEAIPKVKYVYRACAARILRQDFLSSTLAATVLPDLVQRFLPWGFLPDRAGGLEKAWEAAWDEAMGPNGNPDLFAQDFLSAWPPDATGHARTALPALFLNGTSVATGKRIVTSNLDVSPSLADAFDFYHRWPIRIRVSTAANNSARFPIIGPAGTLRLDATEGDTGEMDRVVDGGYFENFGAATALELLQAIERASCREPPKSCAYDLVVIQISSDPGYRGVESDGAAHRPIPSPGSFAAELRSPVKTLLNTRTARGVLAAQTLHNWVAGRSGDSNARFIEFRLDIAAEESEPPLGWILSQAAAQTMDCQLDRPSNRASLERLGGLLGFDPAPFLNELKAECD